MNRYLNASIVILSLCLPFQALSADISSSVDAKTLSKSRQTPFGLYLTPKDAHAALNDAPSIIMIDVRDPVEISFVGHPSGMDANVPLATATGNFNPKRGAYNMEGNVNFLNDMEAFMARNGYKKTDRIFVTCRSGSRSAAAARLLHEAGYEDVWNLVEGFEGSIDKKTGGRSKDGWRNAGLPWSYKIPATAAWQPSQ